MKSAPLPEAPTGPTPAGVQSVDVGAERRTRTDVIQRLLTDGPSTAGHLAQALGLSGTAVRRHLDVLASQGAVTSRDETVVGRRGRGRPARVYLLTDLGRAKLPHAYDDLATQALAYLAEHAGPEAVTKFARQRAQRLVDGVRAELDATDTVAGRTRILADALTGSGYAASVEQVRDGGGGPATKGEQLCQHHCPVAHVAAQYPQLCEQELVVFTSALGTYAQRLATIARGDSFCTTFIPVAPPPASRGPAPSPADETTAGTQHPDTDYARNRQGRTSI